MIELTSVWRDCSIEKMIYRFMIYDKPFNWYLNSEVVSQELGTYSDASQLVLTRLQKEICFKKTVFYIFTKKVS